MTEAVPGGDASQIENALRERGLDRRPADWDARLDAATEADVRRELDRTPAPFSVERMQLFLSRAADRLLEPMARQAHALTLQRFGNTVSLYAPLYLSNHCVNRCRYCGFHAGHDIPRRRLDLAEAEAEAEILHRDGFRDILLVAGEDSNFITPAFLAQLSRRLRPRFDAIALEVEPLPEAGYRALFEAGAEGVTLYQETYDRDRYAAMHPSGPKADYSARLARQEGAARAGMRRLGIGALLGLGDWRHEAVCLALHAHLLMKHFWRARVAISFPRLRPAPHVREEEFAFVDDRALTRMLLALRLCFPDAGLVVSTREPAALRDALLPLGVTQMSAGSKTRPGGYGAAAASGDESADQFHVGDTRTAAEVSAMLRERGYDPVWKDWDPAFQKA